VTAPVAGRPGPRRDLVYRLMILVGRALFRALRLRRVVTGSEHLPVDGGAVLAITHFGYLDFALTEWAVWTGRHRLIRFLATRASFTHPVAGPLMRAMGHVAVDRSAGGGAYAEAVAAVRRGELVGIFPEGRVSQSWTVLDCRTGAARLAAQAGVPLLPVTLWGGHRVSTRGRIVPGPRSIGVPVLIDIGPPVPPDPSGDPRATTQTLQRVLATQMLAAQLRYPDRPRATRSSWWQPAELGGTAPPPHPITSTPADQLTTPVPRSTRDVDDR
jgi:1-acyl-sn-glycerol-3-phosphate acyltransferase